MRDSKFRFVQGARLLRKSMTEAEKILWRYLSNRGMVKHKFRRQYPIGGFIIDFFCPEKKLAIEVDGKIHSYKEKADKIRQERLEQAGISFLRFKNEEIINNIDFVLKKIKRALIPSPIPLEKGVTTNSRDGMRICLS